MARFSRPSRVTVQSKAPSMAPPSTTNLAGGLAHVMPLRHEVASHVLNSMLQDRFYQSGQEGLGKIQDLIDRLDKAGDLIFAAKTAVYARRVHGLRSISQVIAGEIGDRGRGAGWRAAFYDAVVARPDDMSEILAYWNDRHREIDGSARRAPNPMLRGFSRALRRFDAYQLAKWRGASGAVQLHDVANLCHVRAPEGSPIHALMKGELASADTWEKSLSAAGQSEDGKTKSEEEKTADKGKEWARLLQEKKLPYFAAVRNVCNIVRQAPDTLPLLCALLTNKALVQKSRVFPFQMETAYQQAQQNLENSKEKVQVLKALATALDLSVENVPEFSGETLIVVDESGSMTSAAASGGENRTVADVAALFAAVLLKRNAGADHMQFANDARYLNLDTVGLSTLALADAIRQTMHGGGTAFNTIFSGARKCYDRIIILSDMQGWVGGGAAGVQMALISYCEKHRKVPFVYSFDLAGHGTSQFPAERLALLAGFSAKIFDTMALLETDKNALIKEIDETALVAPAAPPRRKPKETGEG